MHSATKITAAVALLAVVATADMRGRHAEKQARFNNRLAHNADHVAHITAHTQAEEAEAEHRLMVLLEKTRATTEHNIAVDAAHYKILDAKLHRNIGELDHDITEHDGKLALTKKQELLAANQIHELTARLARLAKHHVELVRHKGIEAAKRAAVTGQHEAEIKTLTKELNNVLATIRKLDSMASYLDSQKSITFAELEAVMTAHANGESEAMGPFHAADIHDAAHFENKVKEVTDEQRAKGEEIFKVLQEFLGMLKKEAEQTRGAITRSNNHFTTAIKVLDLTDQHINNEMRDVELDEKTSSEHLSAQKVRLLDLQHKDALLVSRIKVEHEQHDMLDKEQRSEAVAEDRKQHNFQHEHDVENTLINMLGGKEGAPVQTEFKGMAAKQAEEKSKAAREALDRKLHEQATAAEAEKARILKAHADKAAEKEARRVAKAQADAAREEAAHQAAEAREAARKHAEEQRRAAVAAEKAAAQVAREQAEHAAAEKAAADKAAKRAAKKAARAHYQQQLAEEAEKEAKDRKDAHAAAIAHHQAAQANVAAQEAERQKAVADAAAHKAAEFKAHQDAVLKEHTEAMAKAQAAAAEKAAGVAKAQAEAFQAKQKQIADEAKAAQDALAARVAAAEAKAAEAAKREQEHREQVARARAAARAAREKAKADAEAAAAAARKAEVERRRQAAADYHAAKKAVYHQ